MVGSTLTPQKLFIAGAWENSSKPLSVLNPNSLQPCGSTYFAEEGQIERALAAAA